MIIIKVVIAEKPSVARDIARVIGANNKKNGYLDGNNYIVTWCIGHLVGLLYPEAYDEKYKKWNLEDLPIIPEKFKYGVLKQTKEQFDIIKELINRDEVTEIIFGADAGREGELINRLVYNQARCKKPIKRLWISSMTDEAIQNGFNNLKDGKIYDNLYKSAECRAIADWLIGMNATRKYSVVYSKLTLGRVQTPTLSMIVQRQNEIDNFVSKPFYEIISQYNEFEGKYINKDNESKIDNIDVAEQIINECRGFNGFIESIEEKQKKLNAPLPYDLTELQREANKKFGYTAQKTLDIAQSLYEKHKATTYPRTDSRYLSDDMESTFEGVLNAIGYNFYSDVIIDIPKQSYKLKCINNSKVSDHHAIIPTNKKIELSSLNDEERKIYKLICTRFVIQFLKAHEFEETIVKVNIRKNIFISKGVVISEIGWKALENDSDNEKEEKASILPKLTKGEDINVVKVYRADKKTSPKKPYTEATLLTAMENAGQFVEDEELREQLKEKGLGTPATRANIIEKIINEGYVVRNGKNLIPTDRGISLIKIAPLELKSPKITGEWEQKLNLIANGKLDSNVFLDEIKTLTRTIINLAKDKNIEFQNDNKNNDREKIGICPRCNLNVYESDKSYCCEGYNKEPKCTFSLWKQNKFYGNINKTQAKALIKGNKALFKNLTNKKGNKYEAYLTLEDTGTFVNLKFDSFHNKK